MASWGTNQVPNKSLENTFKMPHKQAKLCCKQM
uniref:Uncharacterized protein n=1 Tax=Arundo donax TaxID=35708 RepID=A0A0A9B1E1_ARUDO